MKRFAVLLLCVFTLLVSPGQWFYQVLAATIPTSGKIPGNAPTVSPSPAPSIQLPLNSAAVFPKPVAPHEALPVSAIPAAKPALNVFAPDSEKIPSAPTGSMPGAIRHAERAVLAPIARGVEEALAAVGSISDAAPLQAHALGVRLDDILAKTRQSGPSEEPLAAADAPLGSAQPASELGADKRWSGDIAYRSSGIQALQATQRNDGAPSWRRAIMVGLGLTGVLGAIFYGLDRFNAQRAAEGGGFLHLATFLDDAIPFSPRWVWVYLSWFPYCLLTLTRIVDRARLRVFAEAFALASLAAAMMFLLFPSRILPPPLQGHSPTVMVMHLVRAMDLGHNCLPSLHVADSVLVALIFHWTGSRFRGWMWLWAALIVASTVLVKQHYLIDLPAGALLGAAAAAWASWRGGFGPFERKVEKAAFKEKG